MTYIVYHVASTDKIREFATASAAKRSTTCANRNAGTQSYAYADAKTYWNQVVTTKRVVNLLTGKEVEIPSNTPACCDPSTETYWSM